jgi:hypothetical protein
MQAAPPVRNSASVLREVPGYDNGGRAKANGITVQDRNQIYRVKTADRFYLLEGGHKQELDLGATISFRLEKHRAVVLLGKKEEVPRRGGRVKEQRLVRLRFSIPFPERPASQETPRV